jgi:hypothetical protein
MLYVKHTIISINNNNKNVQKLFCVDIGVGVGVGVGVGIVHVEIYGLCVTFVEVSLYAISRCASVVNNIYLEPLTLKVYHPTLLTKLLGI